MTICLTKIVMVYFLIHRLYQLPAEVYKVVTEITQVKVTQHCYTEVNKVHHRILHPMFQNPVTM